MSNGFDEAEERGIQAEAIEQVYSELPLSLITTTALAALVVFVLRDTFGMRPLAIWFGAVHAVVAARWTLFLIFRGSDKAAVSPRRWRWLYTCCALTAAATWGSAPVVFHSHSQPYINVFLAFVLGGVVSGAAATMAPLKQTTRAYVLLVCVPLATVLIVIGDSLHVTMGIMMFLYAAAYTVMSGKISDLLTTSLRLRRENLREIEDRKEAEASLRQLKDGLAKTVEDRTAQLKAVNVELHDEITVRRSVEAKLRESQERYRELVESSSDWIWEVDQKGIYTYSNPRVTQLLGYDKDEIVGRGFYEFIDPGEADRIKDVFAESVAAATPLVGVVNRCVCKDGGSLVMETSARPILNDEGQCVGYQGIDRDISHRLENEEEARKADRLESLGLLAGGIAHDFNNLLAGLLGNIELAKMALPADAGASSLLTNAVKEIECSRELTGQILTFSRGGKPVLESCSLGALLHDACPDFEDSESISVGFDIPDTLWQAPVDTLQMRQVFSKLLQNAREALRSGGTIIIRAENATITGFSPLPLVPGEYVQVTIQDNGCGIKEEDLPHIFDPYFSTKERGSQKGTGIGLTVCRSVVQQHRGFITVRSAYGKGTDVSLFIPAESARNSIWAHAGESDSDTTVPRIMVLEDDATFGQMMVEQLRSLGYAVVPVNSGRKMIELYERSVESQQPCDLLLMDLVVDGGMGGKETLEKLREKYGDVKAVVVSGYAESPVFTDYGKYGFSAALAKPVDLDFLAETVARMLA